jgi:hypothetical protein
MVKYKAIGKIEAGGEQAGFGEDEGHKKKVFEDGQIVTGLPKETMRQLWDAGALEKVEEEKASDGDTEHQPGSEGDAGTGRVGSTDGKPAGSADGQR